MVELWLWRRRLRFRDVCGVVVDDDFVVIDDVVDDAVIGR